VKGERGNEGENARELSECKDLGGYRERRERRGDRDEEREGEKQCERTASAFGNELGKSGANCLIELAKLSISS